MDVVDSRTEQLLQAAAFGMLLADKSLRKRLEPADLGAIYTTPHPAALAELTGKQEGQAFFYLSKVLESWGVKWEFADGSPVDAVLARMKRVTARNEALRVMSRLVSDVMESETDEALDAFNTRLRNLDNELERERTGRDRTDAPDSPSS